MNIETGLSIAATLGGAAKASIEVIEAYGGSAGRLPE